jgi:hypothetical protein
MPMVTLPEDRPLSPTQRAQLETDIEGAILESDPGTVDGQETWSVLKALWYLFQNPAPPPEEE